MDADVCIRRCTDADRDAIFSIINDAAQAYRGVIPADCWQEPYMPLPYLDAELAAQVHFFGYASEGRLIAVMGAQDRGEVTLIRHAYVRTAVRRRGVGTALLRFVETLTTKPLLVGTWAAAHWAIDFYRRSGYRLIEGDEKDVLLRRHWSVPERQMETSVVLARMSLTDHSSPASHRVT